MIQRIAPTLRAKAALTGALFLAAELAALFPATLVASVLRVCAIVFLLAIAARAVRSGRLSSSSLR